MELGANIGLNLIALKKLLPDANLSAVEINPKAVAELKKLNYVEVYSESILKFNAAANWDMIFTKGVLIHLPPESLSQVYKLMYELSRKYIMIAEYYNPTPIEIPYRGYSKKLFKRDFAGELLELYPDLQLVDYGFVYHKDGNFPQDDLNWFLLKK